MNAKKPPARPIPAKHEARAAELKAQGFNVWAKADGSIGWGAVKAKPAPAPAGEAKPDAAPKPAPETPGESIAGAAVAVGLALVGLAVAAVAGWKHLRRTP